MLDYVAEELSATPGWRRVLEAYASASLTAAPAAAPAGDAPAASEGIGWVSRLARLDGIEPERLSSVHGKLIALGLLSFEVSGKTGMQYQLSPLGHRTLGQRPPGNRMLGRRTSGQDLEEQSIDEMTALEADDSESSDA
jgi:hypothetical protein